ncbi:MAG: YbhB/YbcL family Raf kinase inhibitor-like protein [Byssovorax sp.]
MSFFPTSRVLAGGIAVVALAAMLVACGGSSAPAGTGGTGTGGGTTTGVGTGAGGGTGTGGVVDAGPDAPPSGPLVLSSSAFTDGGTLPEIYTCDGQGLSPPLSWTGIPAETVELALMMTTQAKDGEKWNWVLFHVPSSTTALLEGDQSIGTAGLTSDGPNLAYSPPCSQGPGAKVYTFTLYALSATPSLPAIRSR